MKYPIKDKYSITIGIPAYNEENNIGSLLKQIINSRNNNYILDKIIVISDGSTDRTTLIVNSFKHPIIQLFAEDKRKGLSCALNIITKISKSEILIILNADISISNPLFINHLVNSLVNNNADLTAAAIKPLTPRGFYEQILQSGYVFKNSIFENHKSGNNVYTCCGMARALSRKLYKKIKFHIDTGEDAYSYIFCIYNNLKYVYAKEAILYFRLPNNFEDHKKQSVRFFDTKTILKKDFEDKFIETEYKLPFNIIFNFAAKAFIKDPIKTLFYLLLVALNKVISLRPRPKSLGPWEIASSTKSVLKIHEN